MSARCDVYTEKTFRGVCIQVAEIMEDGSIVRFLNVVYTPELARRVARAIEIEADKIDALGGSTEQLKTICGTQVEKRGGGS
jgi:hypothetical protein